MNSRDKVRFAAICGAGACVGAAASTVMTDRPGAATGFVVTAVVLITFVAVTGSR